MSCTEEVRVSRLRRIVLAACTVAVLLAAPAAQAVLGGDASTIGADERRLNGVRRQSASLQTQVQTHVIALADGSSIREFIAPGGIVFAVSWNTHFKPNLESLLGTHAAGYAAAASDALRTPGIKRNVTLQHGDLVVHAATHLNAFVGRAYLRSLVPQGIRADELR